MPIRFRCQGCQQRLSVGRKKAGSVVVCPKCKSRVVVPTMEAGAEPSAVEEPSAPPPAPVLADSPAEGEPTPAVPYPEFAIYDYETELVYDLEADDQPRRAPLDWDKVAVPRWVLYAQGVLLGVTALVGFGLGAMMRGGAPRDGEAAAATGPLTLTGSVAYNAGDHLPTPDHGAAVLLLPEDARPEQKPPSAPFRPGSLPVDASDPAIAAIRQIGGDFVRADGEGKFRLVAPSSGSYFLLILSAHLNRAANERTAPQDLAELGRYVESAPELLDRNRYHWTRRRLSKDETVSHVFR